MGDVSAAPRPAGSCARRRERALAPRLGAAGLQKGHVSGHGGWELDGVQRRPVPAVCVAARLCAALGSAGAQTVSSARRAAGCTGGTELHTPGVLGSIAGFLLILIFLSLHM